MCKLFVCRLIPVLFLVILVVSMDDEGLQLLPLPSEEDLRFDLNHTSEVEAVRQVDMSKAVSGLGTFGGVFVPCVMSIFGVILFERYAWVIGRAGLGLGMLIVFLSFASVTLTALSLSAIATNGEMKGGGAYYMISRSLGPALGGSIGVIFYCANVAAGGTYLLGLEYAVVVMLSSTIEDSYWNEVLIGSGFLLLFAIISLVGAGAFAKSTIFLFVLQWVTLIAIFGSLLFFTNEDQGLTGWSVVNFSDNFAPLFSNTGSGYHDSFQSVFAVFFPAATGIMAGANMSGDLKDPGRSIPKGTLLAIAVTGLYYVLLGLSLAFTVVRSQLAQTKTIVLNDICFWPPIVSVGVLLSTASSALNSLIGGARILQAFAQDDLVFGMKYLAQGSGANNEPRVAVVFTWFLMQAMVFGGKKRLNFFATLTTMFFLLSYGVVNFACFVLRAVASPNFRPVFKYFNRYASLLGACLCIGGMFFVSAANAAYAVLLMILLYVFIAVRRKQTSWGDITQAIIYHQVRKYLLQLDARKDHLKFWRPQIILFISNTQPMYRLIDFVNNLKKSGLYILATVLVADHRQGGSYHDFFNAMIQFVDKMSLKAFPEIVLCSSVYNGIRGLLFSAGLGMMKPNTVIFGFWNENQNQSSAFEGSLWQTTSRSRCHREKLETVSDLFVSLADNTAGLSAKEYLMLVDEAIYFQKNVLIARNFHLLDKDAILECSKSANQLSIDLWVVDLSDEIEFDRTCRLILLLGYIIKQVVFNLALRLLLSPFLIDRYLAKPHSS